MPALVSHHRFAAASLAQAQPYLANAVAAAPMAFRWGAQGPDILSYYRPFFDNRVSRIGTLMHDARAARVFSAMTAECAKQNTPESTAYLLGFCCHYALDRAAEPFITYIANYRLDPLYPQFPHTVLYNLCKSELDRALLEQNCPGCSAQYRAYMQLSADPASVKTAGQLLSHTVWNVYGTRLTQKEVKSSMHSMLRTYHLLHDKTGRRTAALGRMETVLGAHGVVSSHIRPVRELEADCVNRSHKMWINAGMPHMRSYTDYFQIFNQAQYTAARLMDICYDCVQTGNPLPQDLFQLNFNGLPK